MQAVELRKWLAAYPHLKECSVSEFIQFTKGVKMNEWKTPIGENPIEYHAYRLGNEGGKYYIVKDKNGDYWVKKSSKHPLGTLMMDEETADKICFALNLGELKETK